MKYETELLESINYYLKEIYTILINHEREEQKEIIETIKKDIQKPRD